MGYDDPLGDVGIHGMSGMFGILATGLFASQAINAVMDGFLFENAGQFGIQVIML
jgi:ammonium transporter, Amt family